MPEITIYKKATGQITKRMNIPSSQILVNVAFDEEYILGSFNKDHFYVKLTGANTNTDSATPRDTQDIVWDKTQLIANGSDTLTGTNVVANTTFVVEVATKASRHIFTIPDTTIQLITNVVLDPGETATMKVITEVDFTYLIEEYEVELISG